MKRMTENNQCNKMEKLVVEHRDMISLGVSAAAGVLIANVVTDMYRFGKHKASDMIQGLKSKKKNGTINRNPSSNLDMDDDEE